MNQLIEINTNELHEPIVSGRTLHEVLEVKTPYDKWFPRMAEYGFVEGEDFSTFLSESTGGRPATDHVIKLDMAKEIAMIQRTDKGKEVRQYFIQVEKEFNSPEKIMARALMIAENQISTLKLENKVKQQVIKELKPKADYVDKILKSKSLMLISQISKDYGMSSQAMNKLLHELKVQYKQGGQWLLYARYQDKGYTHSETFDYEDSYGNTKVSVSTKWTQKGRLFLYELLKSEGVVPVIEREDVA